MAACGRLVHLPALIFQDELLPELILEDEQRASGSSWKMSQAAAVGSCICSSSKLSRMSSTAESPTPDCWCVLILQTSFQALSPSGAVSVWRKMMREYAVDSPMEWTGMQEPLAEDQLAHIHRLCEHLRRGSTTWSPLAQMEYPVGIDTSDMGCGKTRCAQGVASLLGLPIFVIRPPTVDAWEAEAEMTGVELVESIGYERLRSVPGKTHPDHRWLTREDGGEKGVVFTATAEWVERVRKGVLLVVDEAHLVKNDSANSAAVQELIRVVVEEWEQGPATVLLPLDRPAKRAKTSRSRALLLSGSLFDKPKYATRMCEVMGLLPAGERDPGAAWTGSRSAAWGYGRAEETSWSSWKAFQRFVWRDFTRVVMKRVSSSMPVSKHDPWAQDMAVGFYRMGAQDLLEMEGAVDDLEAAREELSDEGGLGAVMKALARAHRAKVGMTVRLVSQCLDANPQAQAVVFGWFNESLQSIAEQLSRFDPQLFTGKVSKGDRSGVVARFQSGQRRLLVCNMKVGGVGLNMQDLHGNRPRHVYMLPMYHATDMLQASKRCYRRGVQSHVVVRVLFAHGAENELKVLANLAGKTSTWKTLMPEQVEQGKKFLEDNPHVEETEDFAEVPRVVESMEVN